MKRGKDLRTPQGQPFEPIGPSEVMALMFVMVEAAPGAFTLRLVSNDDLFNDLESQGELKTLLTNIDQLYADFRSRFELRKFSPLELIRPLKRRNTRAAFSSGAGHKPADGSGEYNGVELCASGENPFHSRCSAAFHSANRFPRIRISKRHIVAEKASFRVFLNSV